jgi:hypothetical protein
MDIIAITISVNYDDILIHMLKQNSQFLKTWYIVTSSTDKDTINLITNSNIPNIKMLFYDDFWKDAIFNKGGAVRFAQEYIYNNYESCNILILDSDIYLPDNFSAVTSSVILEDDTLYGTRERIDYHTLHNFVNNTTPRHNSCGDAFIGFFQLYKSSIKYKYDNSYDCGGCDNYFRDLFNKKVILDISVKHLGKCCENWSGRDKDKGQHIFNNPIVNNINLIRAIRLNKYKKKHN